VSDEQEPVLVRATINLAGLRVGEYALVDPRDDYIKDALGADHLVVVDEEELES
jgi:hypothetical protein